MATLADSGVPAPVAEMVVELRLPEQGSFAMPGRQSQVVVAGTVGVALGCEVAVGCGVGVVAAFEPQAVAKAADAAKIIPARAAREIANTDGLDARVLGRRQRRVAEGNGG